MHKEKKEELAEKKRQVLSSLSLSNLSLRDKASMAMSPRVRESAASFGSTSPRPHLWLGATAAAGPTCEKAAVPSSPRGSRRGSSTADAAGRDDAPVEDAPGPGAYEQKSQFKSDLRKDPSAGASSAFKSKTKRHFGETGKVLDTDVYPGRAPTDGPGVGTYAVKDYNTIGAAAAAIARRVAKIQNARPSGKAQDQPDRFKAKAPEETPGPGSYEVDRLAKQKAERQYDAKNMAFKSGSRRALPWGGRGDDVARSTRARKVDDLEVADMEGPGPGEYKMPSSFDKAAAVARRGATGAWTKGAPRFKEDTPLEDLTPSAVHYTPNYNALSK